MFFSYKGYLGITYLKLLKYSFKPDFVEVFHVVFTYFFLK